MRYRDKVVGIKAYERGLKAEIERVRQLGLENRERMADPNVNSRKSVWHDHADAETPYEVSPRRARVSRRSCLLTCLQSYFGAD